MVTIGTANCVVIKVSDNVLQCEPPNDKPEPSPEDTDGQLFVKVISTFNYYYYVVIMFVIVTLV